MIPHTCYHGVRMMGPNPPPCRECEIIWYTDTLKWLNKSTERATRKLAALLDERDAVGATKRQDEEEAASQAEPPKSNPNRGVRRAP